MTEQNEQAKQLTAYMQWLDSDPDNIALRADAIGCAIDLDDLDIAGQLIADADAEQRSSPEIQNLAGMVALRKGDFKMAKSAFGALLEAGHDSPATRFNLAWSHAVSDERGEALALLDDATVAALPQAAALKVQMMHAEGAFDEAMDAARQLAEMHPADPGLMAAMSVLALDVEDIELARRCAEKGGGHPDALTTLGTLQLGDHELERAQASFAQALKLNESNPRAWVGQGLTRLSGGDKTAALADLDRGAKLFETHAGSWIAAGWAYFINNDLATARDRFQKALDLDDSFAESQGSLAVVDAAEGDIENADRRAEVALRLDRQCFSAALAKSLVLEAKGDKGNAARIIEMAMNMPIDATGGTLADNLVRMSGGIPSQGKTLH